MRYLFWTEEQATGREAILLHKKGYKIHVNNIDDNMRFQLYDNLLKKLSKEEAEDFKKSRSHIASWLLFEHYFEDTQFDVVLLIGNFLSRLLNENERIRTLDQCFRILKPGGIFIIDKRNFDRIIAKKDDGICSFDGFYNKVYSRKYMYRGDSVRGWPKNITNDKIEFVVGEKAKEYQPTFKMYTFRDDTAESKNDRDKLKYLLDRYFQVKIYQDHNLEKPLDESPDYSNVEADFIVYVAYKSYL